MTTVSKNPAPGTPLTPNFTPKDYSIFFLAGGCAIRNARARVFTLDILTIGAICATATHGAATPIDVVKTRVQIDPALAKHSLLQGGRKIVAAEGPRGLLTGFGPTAVGYFVQGGGKFAGYEYASTFDRLEMREVDKSFFRYWKKKFVDLTGSQEKAVQYRLPIYLGAAAVGEFFADILLTPLEATRIRLVSDRKYASGLVTGFARLAREGGIREMYAGFLPILCKCV
ncbi:hypothetical protein FRB90_011815 [Tulasnella sp. 427]|nr:hypothetical protein FRB90_011815 [Tulasnella sp. 427]